MGSRNIASCCRKDIGIMDSKRIIIIISVVCAIAHVMEKVVTCRPPPGPMMLYPRHHLTRICSVFFLFFFSSFFHFFTFLSFHFFFFFFYIYINFLFFPTGPRKYFTLTLLLNRCHIAHVLNWYLLISWVRVVNGQNAQRVYDATDLIHLTYHDVLRPS